jgi:hypothetical protein
MKNILLTLIFFSLELPAPIIIDSKEFKKLDEFAELVKPETRIERKIKEKKIDECFNSNIKQMPQSNEAGIKYIYEACRNLIDESNPHYDLIAYRCILKEVKKTMNEFNARDELQKCLKMSEKPSLFDKLKY